MSRDTSLRLNQRPQKALDSELTCVEGPPRSIGSDFETADKHWHNEAPQRAPWDFPETNLEYVQTGRQALTAIAVHLMGHGYDRIVFPGHFCESMISPFSGEGFNVVTVPVTDSLRMDLERTWDAVQESLETTVVFGVLYFGEEPNQNYADFIRTLSQNGVPTIEDETHRIFRPGGVHAEFAVGSLRKLLPVADGAYIRHRKRAIILSEISNSNMGELRWAAMDAKAQKKPYSTTAFQEANSALESGLAAMRISDRSISSLNSLNYAKLSTQRADNADVFYSVLDGSGIPILQQNWYGIIPSHLVVRTRDAARLQHEMAAHRIYCPIHWPSPKSQFPGLKWKDDLLSVPVDHRYLSSDMERAASTLRKVWSS